MKRLRVLTDNNTQHHFICACKDCKNNDECQEAWNFKHALKLGWKFTGQKKFSQDGETVGVCPKCAKEYEWTQIKTRELT